MTKEKDLGEIRGLFSQPYFYYAVVAVMLIVAVPFGVVIVNTIVLLLALEDFYFAILRQGY